MNLQQKSLLGQLLLLLKNLANEKVEAVRICTINHEKRRSIALQDDVVKMSFPDQRVLSHKVR